MKIGKVGLFALCVCMVGAVGADTFFISGDAAEDVNWTLGRPGSGNVNFENVGIVTNSGTVASGNQGDARFSGATITISNAATWAFVQDVFGKDTTYVVNDGTITAGDDVFTGSGSITLNAGSSAQANDDFESQGGGTLIINGGAHSAGDYFGIQGSGGELSFLGGTVQAGRLRFDSGSGPITIGGGATAIASGTTLIADLDGTVNIQSPWAGSLKAANFSGSDWQTVVTGSWQLDGNALTAFDFSANFLVTDGGTTLLDINTPANLPKFIDDPVVKANAQNGSDYVSEGQTLAGSATNSFGATMSYEKVGGPEWLVVAANGALSGTPTITATDEFTIRAYTGDYSSLGTLQITVDPLGNPPEFTSDPVVKADGAYNEDYALLSETLADDAIDLDGDTLSFSKVDGPAWLTVATNGALSGICTISGTNTFTVAVDDGTGSSATAALQIYVQPLGNVPEFTTDPIIKADGEIGSDYALESQSLTNSATDADGDTLTYTKTGGPAWLNIETNGALSGVCDTLGTNTFSVTVTDGNGNFDTATLQIFVDVVPQGDLIAGWDTFSGTGSGGTPVDGAFLASGISASFVSTTEGDLWGITDERGASIDGTWGLHTGPPVPSMAVVDGENLHLPNGTTGGTLTFTIINDGDEDLELGKFHFDAYAFRPNAARAYELSVLAGGGLTEGVVFTSEDDAIKNVFGANSNLAHDDIDIALTGLADHVLAVGEFVQLELAFSSGTGSGGGHHLFVDNIGLSTAPVIGPPSEQPVMSSEIIGGDLRISWTEEGFILQTRPNLVIGDWAAVPGGDVSPVTVPMTNNLEFLRLIWSAE